MKKVYQNTPSSGFDAELFAKFEDCSQRAGVYASSTDGCSRVLLIVSNSLCVILLFLCGVYGGWVGEQIYIINGIVSVAGLVASIGFFVAHSIDVISYDGCGTIAEMVAGGVFGCCFAVCGLFVGFSNNWGMDYINAVFVVLIVSDLVAAILHLAAMSNAYGGFRKKGGFFGAEDGSQA